MSMSVQPRGKMMSDAKLHCTLHLGARIACTESQQVDTTVRLAVLVLTAENCALYKEEWLTRLTGHSWSKW